MTAEQAGPLSIEDRVRMISGRKNRLMVTLAGFAVMSFVIIDRGCSITLLFWCSHMWWNGHTAIYRHPKMKAAGGLPISVLRGL